MGESVQGEVATHWPVSFRVRGGNKTGGSAVIESS